MNEIKKIYYLTPALITFLLFLSNFIKSDLVQHPITGYGVWFILMVFIFACGYLMNKTLGYSFGGKIIFAVIVANVFIAILLVTIFRLYFGMEEMTAENAILYSLRIISLGSMGYFGLAINEVFRLQERLSLCEQKTNVISNDVSSNKDVELTIKEARLKADKILLEAEAKLKDITAKTEQFENKLRELIKAERELIKKYESNEE